MLRWTMTDADARALSGALSAVARLHASCVSVKCVMPLQGGKRSAQSARMHTKCELLDVLFKLLQAKKVRIKREVSAPKITTEIL